MVNFGVTLSNYANYVVKWDGKTWGYVFKISRLTKMDFIK